MSGASGGAARTIEAVRREFREHEEWFEKIRGYSECMFCRKWASGPYFQRGQRGYVCVDCMAEPEVLAAAVAKKAAEGGKGEEIEIPYLKEAKKKVNVTVEVRDNWDEEDFEEVSEEKTWKMENPYRAAARRNYFVKKSARVTVGITNLESRGLTLQVTHVDENFKFKKMEEVFLTCRGLYKYELERFEGEDRETLQVCDSAGGLSLMLSFQEELAAMSKKRKVAVGDGSAAAPIVFEDADLDQALRSLWLLGVGAGGAS
jgi:hypothetical protein